MRRLLITMLATILLASGVGAAEDTTDSVAAPFSVLTNATLSCSAKLPSVVVGCFIEKRVLTFGNLEMAVGVDAQAALRGGDSHLAPYGILALYQPTWSAWIEIMLPTINGIPTLGAPDWLRLGITYTFQ